MRLALARMLRPASAIALLAGATLVQALPGMPPRAFDAALALVALLMAAVPRTRWVGVALLGAAWTMYRADLALSQRLPHALQGVDLIVEGRVQGLPRAEPDATRFEFQADAATYRGQTVPLTGRMRLSWYDTRSASPPHIAPCTRWRLQLRLKRPRGGVNPGGFDFERYALQSGIIATGYVRNDAANAPLSAPVPCIDAFRSRILDTISVTLGPGSAQAHLLRALAFGDEQAMDDREWAVARATGIPHLIAISGLHIALFAGFGVLLVRLAWKCVPRVTLRCPAPLVEAVASLAFAIGYALIAGFGLPTRRALVMIAALLVANLARRARAPVHGLALAVIVLLCANPLCVLSAGFWLSFVGVAWLMFCLGAGAERSRWLREMATAQGVASIGLLPLGIWFFGQSSLVGPLANLVAVPVICFLVLPLAVGGALLALPLPALGAPLLQLAGWVLQGLWWLLQHLAAWPGSLWYFPEASLPALALAMLGAAWLLLPRGVPLRGLGAVLLLPLLFPQRAPLPDGAFDAYMLDVGQGLSFVVQTRAHALVYDTGARFASGFDLGEATVVPAIHALGIARPDRLVVSHADNDHAGGAGAVVAAWPALPVESGDPQRLALDASQCQAGENWEWDGVRFRIVHPALPAPQRENDRSCVLEIRTAANALLLTGDISRDVEPAVAAALEPMPSRLVLQVPHHGSKTSSSNAFLAALAPRLALVSSGYHNRFHHPSAEVVARYAAARIALLDTQQAGYVAVHFDRRDAPYVTARGRIDRHPYWRED